MINCGPEIRNGGGNKLTNDLRDCDMDYNQGEEIRSEINEEVEMDAWCDTGRKDKKMSTVPIHTRSSRPERQLLCMLKDDHLNMPAGTI